MPVVKTNKSPAKMVEQEVSGYGAGINTFLVDKQRYVKYQVSLGSIIPGIQKHVEPVGIFELADLQIGASSRRPIATIEPDLVVQLMSTVIHVGGLTAGADYHILVKNVRFPQIKDGQVKRFIEKHKFKVVASLLHHYGELTAPFVNRYAKQFDEEYEGSTKYGTRIYLKGSIDSPKYFVIPFLYKFGCRFMND